MNAVWHRYLPGPLRRRLDGRFGLQAAVGNSGWLLADKFVRLGGGLLIGIWVVRYLGPTQLGMLSYAGAFGGFFGTFAALGLDGLVIRELLDHPDKAKQDALLGTAFVLKLWGGIATLLITMLAIWLARPGEGMIMLLVGLTAAGFMFQSLNVIDFYFQSTVQSKYVVFASNAAFVLMSIAKIVLLVTSASLVWFALLVLGEVILNSAFLALAYRWRGRAPRDWRYEPLLARDLLKRSWPLILSGLTVMIYMRIDQVMIGQMLGDKEVGLFAAAVRLSEIWYFVPAAIASSVFPAIMRAKQQGESVFQERIQKLYDFMTWLALGVAVATTLLAHWVIHLLYGPAYAESADVLSLQIWAGVPVCMSFVHGRWLIVENLQKYSMYYSGCGAILNVVCNLLLIPIYGIKGAAIATLIAQSAPNAIQYFLPGARHNLYQMLNSFTAPFRVLRTVIDHSGRPA